MSRHSLYANKYQSQAVMFSNPASMVVALSEKAIRCISVAQNGLAKNEKHVWYLNLGTVHEIINLILSIFDFKKDDKILAQAEKFYFQLSVYTNALINEKLDSAKSKDLLEAFCIVRDTWKDIDQKYVALSSKKNVATESVL